MASSVDAYIEGVPKWFEELQVLRSILLETGLVETVKWGGPCYTHLSTQKRAKNVVSLGAFKNYVALWFHQGALLTDAAGVLVNAQAGRTRAMRQWRMAGMAEIDAALISAYVVEAIALVDAGREIKIARNKAVVVPVELEAALRLDRQADAGFRGLTPGRQREYCAYIADAKQAATKHKRIEKILPMIARGSGLNDRYR